MTVVEAQSGVQTCVAANTGLADLVGFGEAV